MKWEKPRDPSMRNQIRDEAERVLRASKVPLHYSRIAELVLPKLGLEGRMLAKRVNDCLHEDKAHRFEPNGKGTWTLRRPEARPHVED